MIPVKKIYATNDGVAPLRKIKAATTNLRDHTHWFEIKGGNHSCGFQLGDDEATISREEQQEIRVSRDIEDNSRITEIELKKQDPSGTYTA